MIGVVQLIGWPDRQIEEDSCCSSGRWLGSAQYLRLHVPLSAIASAGLAPARFL